MERYIVVIHKIWKYCCVNTCQFFLAFLKNWTLITLWILVKALRSNNHETKKWLLDHNAFTGIQSVIKVQFFNKATKDWQNLQLDLMFTRVNFKSNGRFCQNFTAFLKNLNLTLTYERKGNLSSNCVPWYLWV